MSNIFEKMVIDELIKNDKVQEVIKDKIKEVLNKEMVEYLVREVINYDEIFQQYMRERVIAELSKCDIKITL